jgi:ABC-2 type transport system ATP-binding protein
MEVGEQSLYLAQLKGMSRREATKKLKYWFEKFEIQSWWNKKIEELSKGMAQKVQFIITIIHEPELLILDEPFSGFDPVNAEIIKNEILELKKKGTSIIFSTHNMGSVEQMCDEIALINLSKKILSGSVKEIKNQYKSNTYKVKYSGGNAIGLSNALWHRFELKNNVKEGEHFEAEIKIPDELKLNDLLSTLLSEVQILEVHEVIPNMNDIFISKVKELN